MASAKKTGEWPIKELKSGDIVKFKWSTKEYGHAEFGFCPVFKRGKLHEMFILPLQQPNAKTAYHISAGYSTSFTLNPLVNGGQLNRADIWIHSWCKLHKCLSFRAYVPIGSSQFQVSLLSDLGIYFS